MDEIPEGESLHRPTTRRRPDLLSALMIVVTAGSLLGTLWSRFGPSLSRDSPSLGVEAPQIRLLDKDGGEPVVLLGLKGKIVWVAFWSAKLPGGRTGLGRLEATWRRFEGHRKFAMIAPAIEVDDARAVREAIAANHLRLPVYLAEPEMCRNFGVEPDALPLHFVIDAEGRILATSGGPRGNTLDELEAIVRDRLDGLDPAGGTRFAGPGDDGVGLGTDVVAGAAGR